MSRVPDSPPTGTPATDAAAPGGVRRILYADVDSMFVQVARRALGEPVASARLLIVGGSAEGRGVVTSASPDAKAFGIRAGMPTAMAMRRCPEALVVPVPGDAVREASRAIHAVLGAFAPLYEPRSVDEGALDLTGCEALYGGETLEATAHRVRDAVRAQTGYSVTVAGATNVYVAKMATDLAKPRANGAGGTGVYVVPPGEEAAFMRRFALGDLIGIGPSTLKRLHQVGLRTVEDVLPLPVRDLTTIFGPRGGRWLWERVRGIDHGRVTPPGPPKSCSREDTFAEDVFDDATLIRELTRLVTRVVTDLREEGMRCRTVTAKIRDIDWTTRQRSRTVREPIETETAIRPIALELLRQLRRERRVGARLVGVTLGNLSGQPDALQLALPGLLGAAGRPAEPPPESSRDRALADAMDVVRARYGADGVRQGDGGAR